MAFKKKDNLLRLSYTLLTHNSRLPLGQLIQFVVDSLYEVVPLPILPVSVPRMNPKKPSQRKSSRDLLSDAAKSHHGRRGPEVLWKARGWHVG